MIPCPFFQRCGIPLAARDGFPGRGMCHAERQGSLLQAKAAGRCRAWNVSPRGDETLPRKWKDAPCRGRGVSHRKAKAHYPRKKPLAAAGREMYHPGVAKPYPGCGRLAHPGAKRVIPKIQNLY